MNIKTALVLSVFMVLLTACGTGVRSDLVREVTGKVVQITEGAVIMYHISTVGIVWDKPLSLGSAEGVDEDTTVWYAYTWYAYPVGMVSPSIVGKKIRLQYRAVEGDFKPIVNVVTLEILDE